GPRRGSMNPSDIESRRRWTTVGRAKRRTPLVLDSKDVLVRIGIRSKMGLALLGAASLATAAGATASADGTQVQKISGSHVILDFRPHHSQLQTQALATSSTSVRRFTRTVTDGASSFNVTMVGKNPFVTLATPSTTIKTFLVPLKIVLPNGDTFDPTVASP